MEDLLQKIQDLRSKNNEYWIGIIRLALESDRKEEAELLVENIAYCDKRINDLMMELIKR